MSSLSFPGDAKFITLSPEKYPETLNLPETVFSPGNREFCAACFTRRTVISAGSRVHICIFADTKFRLIVNDRVLGVGPVAAGGDYGNKKAMPIQYYNEYELTVAEDYLDILAEVQTPGEVMTDYSVGRMGLVFAADITAPSGETSRIVSDESWLVLRDTRYTSIANADYSILLPKPETPTVIPCDELVWRLAPAAIPPLAEEIILPKAITRTDKGVRYDFARIYSAYIRLEIENRSDSPVTACIYSSEYGTPEEPTETVVFPRGKHCYRGFRMCSIGEVTVETEISGSDADSSDSVTLSLSLVYAHYPVDEAVSGRLVCSDEKLTGIYKLGRDTLEMCRQTLHLDSPLHQETLGCTGDYAIESLMTTVTFGDMRLSRLDLIRTAEYLRMSGGVMFHTSYSLIFVTMLRDYYMYTADLGLVRELMPTVELLFSKFDSYIENNVIENPPDYMFIEWGELDGYNLHHPPKALGQTSLNAFYRMALIAASELYSALCNTVRENELLCRAELHKSACVAELYERDTGIFRDGKSASESVYESVEWLPANSARVYHTRHANILAALCGFVDGDEGRELLERVITKPEDFEDFDIQPYFMHYLMEAVRKYGLFEKYGLGLLHLWDKQLEASPKGMKEGWGKFCGDCSHAWGATPTYQLPMALSGFEMLEPGYAAFRLSPKLYSLDSAWITLPTPHGLIELKLEQGKNADITVPDVYERLGDVYRLRA